MKDKKHSYFVVNLGRYIYILFLSIIGIWLSYTFITSKQWDIEAYSFTYICILIGFFVVVLAFQEACGDVQIPEEVVEEKR